MYEYEWENPSHILLPPPPTSVSSDHPPEAPYSDLPSFIHPPFIPIHHQHYHQPFQTVIDPTASYSNAPLHTDSMLSSADYDTAAAFFSALPKPEPADHTAMDGGEYHNANSSADLDRIGLNLGLGGRTYFSAADESFLNRLYRRSRPFDGSSVAVNLPKCQVEGCTADLSVVKHYHRRHKVCEFHSKASTVVAGGLTQRFCQQCSRFHVLTEFDNGKRSCRRRLADHNRRRRKSHQVPASQDRRSSQPHSKAPNSPASENRPRSPSDSSRAHSVSSLTVQECKINRYNSEASPSVSSNSMFY